MNRIEATAEVFWTAFQSMNRKEKTAFLKRLSDDSDILEILDDLRYGQVIDKRK